MKNIKNKTIPNQEFEKLINNLIENKIELIPEWISRCSSDQAQRLVNTLFCSERATKKELDFFRLILMISKQFWLSKKDITIPEQLLLLASLRIYSLLLVNAEKYQDSFNEATIYYEAFQKLIKLQAKEQKTIEQKKKDHLIADYHLVLGVSFKGLGKYKEGLEHLKKAAEYNPEKAIEVSGQLINCYAEMMVEQKKRPIKISELEEIISKIPKDSLTLVPTGYGIATCYLHFDEFEKAITYATMALEYAVAVKNDLLVARVSKILMTACFFGKKNPEETLKYANCSLLHFSKSQNGSSDLELYDLCLFITAHYRRIKNFDRKNALQYGQKALSIRGISFPQKQVIRALIASMNIYDLLAQEKWKESIESLKPVLLLDTYKIKNVLPEVYYFLAVSYLALGEYKESMEYAKLALKYDPKIEIMSITPDEIIVVSAYSLKEYEMVLKYMPQQKASLNSKLVFMLGMQAALFLKDKESFSKIKELFVSSDHQSSSESYKMLTGTLLAMDLEELFNVKKEDVLSEKNTEESETKKEQEKIEKLGAKINKKLVKSFKEASSRTFFPPIPTISTLSKKEEGSLFRMHASFLSFEKSNIYCTLDKDSKDIKQFKQSYSEAFEKLFNYLSEGLICGKTGQQGIKYLTDSIEKNGQRYHWEVKVLGQQGDYRLLGRKTVDEDGKKTVIVFDTAGDHTALELLQKKHH